MLDHPTPSPAPSSGGSKRWILYVLLAVAVLIGGCNMLMGFVAGKVAEKAVEMGTGVDINRGNGTVTMGKDGDSVTVSTETNGQVALPSGFPTDFPVAPGMTPIQAMTMNDQGKKAFNVTWNTAASIEEIKTYYEKTLTAAGWTKSMSVISADGGTLAFTRGSEENPEKSIYLTITKGDGKTMVSSLITDELSPE
jgi:hypothetical protein